MSRLRSLRIAWTLLACGTAILHAATPAVTPVSTPRYTQTIDLALGSSSTAHSWAVKWMHLNGVGSTRRVKAGLGLRLSSFLGREDTEYTTTDAALVEGGKVNTLTLSRPRTQTLNVAVEVKCRLLAGLEAGFDIDVVGFGFGSTRTGSYRAFDSRSAELQSVRPAAFSLLEGGDADRGQLDSELLLRHDGRTPQTSADRGGWLQ